MLLNYFGEINPLDCIKRNKQDRDIVNYLKKTGIDGFKIADIIYCSFGLRDGYEIPYTEEESKRDKKITSVKKAIQSLCNNSLILDKEKIILRRIQSNLIKRERSYLHIIGENKYNEIYIKKNNSGSLEWTAPLRVNTGVDYAQGKPHAKSKTQALGLQMVALFDYIQNFNIKKYHDQEIHGLISALYKEFHVDGIEYSTEKIKKFIDNNKNIYKKFKASKTFLHFQRDELSMRQIKNLKTSAEKMLKEFELREDGINRKMMVIEKSGPLTKEYASTVNTIKSYIKALKKEHFINNIK